MLKLFCFYISIIAPLVKYVVCIIVKVNYTLCKIFLK